MLVGCVEPDDEWTYEDEEDYNHIMELKNITEFMFLPVNDSDIVTVSGNNSLFYINHSCYNDLFYSKGSNSNIKDYKVEVEGNKWFVNRVINVTEYGTSAIMDIYIIWGENPGIIV